MSDEFEYLVSIREFGPCTCSNGDGDETAWELLRVPMFLFIFGMAWLIGCGVPADLKPPMQTTIEVKLPNGKVQTFENVQSWSFRDWATTLYITSANGEDFIFQNTPVAITQEPVKNAGEEK